MPPSHQDAVPLSPLPGEDALLSAIVASPADDQARLIYADWLEERGDRRGGHLRQFLAALQAGKHLPRANGIPPAWEQLTGLALLRGLQAAGLTEHRGRVLELARPSLALTTAVAPEADIPVAATKFGGRPDLPLDVPWPRCDRGPLRFLAQLDLAEVHPTFAGRALPASGLLTFFLYHNMLKDEFGDGPGGLRVLHTPAGTPLRRLDPPDDLTQYFGRPGPTCRATIAEVLDLPGLDDTWAEAYGPAYEPLREAHLEGDFEMGPIADGDHQLLGYAHVTVLGEDPLPGPDWQLLMRFNSDPKLQWGWGDGHRLFWYVKTADLRRGHLEGTQAMDG